MHRQALLSQGSESHDSAKPGHTDRQNAFTHLITLFKKSAGGWYFARMSGEGMQQQGETMLLRLIHAGEQGRGRFGDLFQILAPRLEQLLTSFAMPAITSSLSSMSLACCRASALRAARADATSRKTVSRLSSSFPAPPSVSGRFSGRRSWRRPAWRDPRRPVRLRRSLGDSAAAGKLTAGKLRRAVIAAKRRCFLVSPCVVEFGANMPRFCACDKAFRACAKAASAPS